MIYAIIFLIILIIGIFLANISIKLLINYYNKYNSHKAHINITSAQLLSYFIKSFNMDILIAEYSTFLDNSYNIKRKIIFLSKDVINNTSVPALAISMHELGHAIQHKNKSKLFYLYYTFSILNKITSSLIIPLFVFLVVSLFLSQIYLNIALILIVCFYLVNLIIRIIIIPLERNASNIALDLLKQYKIFDSDELQIAKKLLNLAALTYVGGFFSNYIKMFKKIFKNF
ncbi:MAG: zinc metallopeptidase [Clostridiales bacterium]|nr:zinc metallopeptidase [Clostridiales bacterium]